MYIDTLVIDSPTTDSTPRVAEKETREQRRWRAYERLAQSIMRRSSDLRWMQGDVANLGEKESPDNYMQAMQGKFGLSDGTITNRQRVCKKFTPDKRLWEVDFMWYEVLQAKEWDVIVEHMDKVERGEYETREQLRAVFRDNSEVERYTTCKVTSITDILLEHFPEDTDFELRIKGKIVKIRLFEETETQEAIAS